MGSAQIMILLGAFCLAHVTLIRAQSSATVTVTNQNGVSAQCVFPFTYESNTYYGCTDARNNFVKWCATVSNLVSGTGDWGACPTAQVGTVTTTGGNTCNFPYEAPGPGGELIFYYGCFNGITESATTPQTTPAGNNQCVTTANNVEDCLATTTASTASTTASTVITISSSTALTTPSTTATATTCGGYDLFVNMHRFGGVLRSVSGSGVSDREAACRAICNADDRSQCVAYDYNRVSRECYTHSTLNNIMNTLADTNHYVRQEDCGVSTGGTPTGTGGSPSCVDTFTRSPGRNYFGGERVFTAATDEACADACRANATCAGYDFAGAEPAPDRRCFLLTEAQIGGAGNPNSAVTHNRRVPCARTTPGPGVCVDTYRVELDTFSYDGEQQPGTTTIAGCERTCNAMADCVGFDIDTRTGCWIHRASNDDFNRKQPSQTPGTTNQYIRIPCVTTPQACLDTFTANPNRFAYGGRPATGTTSNTQCADRCRNDPACIAYDLSRNVECFLHYNQSDIQFPVTGPDVTHYVRNFICRGTTPTPTGPGQCQDNFELFNNTNAAGADRQQGINSLQACRARCLETSIGDSRVCFGFDFNTQNNQCWIHFNADYTPGSATGINHYRRDTATCSVTTGRPVCEDPYVRTQGRNAFGGQESSNTGLQGCQRGCQASNQTCYGFDFNPQSNVCWFFFTNYTLNTNDASPVDNYRRVPTCGGVTSVCRNTYQEVVDRNGFGGTANGARSNATCRDACNALRPDQCFAYDFNLVDSSCFLHESPDYTVNPSTVTGINHYIRSSDCPSDRTTVIPVCRDTFRQTPNRNAFGAVQANNARSQAACVDECLNRQSCTSFDYNRNNRECWIFAQDINANDLRINTDVDHYDRNNICVTTGVTPGQACRVQKLADGSAAGGTPVPGVNTEAGCRQACLDSDACRALDFNYDDNACYIHTVVTGSYNRGPCCARYSKICEGCVDTYNVTRDRNVPGGREITSANSESACERSCTALSNCTGFDFDRSFGGCFVIFVDFTSQAARGVDNYRRIRCGITTVPTLTTGTPTIRTTQCMDTYNRLSDILVFGAEDNGIVANVAGCQRACDDRRNPPNRCEAFDFDTNNNRCWLHRSSSSQYQPAAGVNHYDRISSCDGPSPTATQPTIPPSSNCQTDLHFIVDTSSSTTLTDLSYIQDTMNQIVSNLNVECQNSPINDCVRVGTAIYSSSAYNVFSVNGDATQTLASLQSSISRLPYVNASSANVGEAIQLFLRNYNDYTLPSGRNAVVCMFSSLNVQGSRDQNSFRNQLRNLNSQQNTGRASFMFIGIGNVNQQRRAELVSDGSPRFITNINRGQVQSGVFQAVNGVIGSQMFARCRGQGPTVTPRPTQRPTQRPTPRPVVCRKDIAILIDSSGSINDADPRNWGIVREFVSMLVDRLGPGQIDSRIAMATFSDFTEPGFYFDDRDNNQQDRNGIRNRVRSLRYMGMGTNTTGGLRFITRRVFASNRGDRRNIDNVCILLTDGMPTIETSPQILRETLRALNNQQIQLLGVGVTDRLDDNNFRQIVPQDRLRFMADQFGDLSPQLADQVACRICPSLSSCVPSFGKK